MLLAVVSLSFSSYAADVNYKKIIGVWEFSAPNAPQPYNGGIMTIKEVDNKLVGEFTIQGQPMPIPQVKFEENTLSLGFEVENTSINLVLNLKDGILEGSTETPNGTVMVTAKPSKQETK